MKLQIRPAISPEVRQKIAEVLQNALGGTALLDGGDTNTDGTDCNIFFYPIEGKTEMDIRKVLTGRFDEPPWERPTFDPDKLPTEFPEN